MERSKRYISHIVRIICFICVIALLILMLMSVLTYKDETYSKEVFDDFYELADECVDVIWIGASPIQTSVNPAQIFHESGIAVYGLATSSQPMALAPYLIEEANKSQSPKVYLVDVRMLAFTVDMMMEPVVSEKYTRHVTDCMRPSINRIEAINHMLDILPSTDPEVQLNKWDYYFRLSVYHTRWREGPIALFSNQDDDNSFMGSYVYTSCTPFDEDVVRSRIDVTRGEITDDNKSYLDELLDYADSSDDLIIFTLTPSCVDREYFDRYTTIKGLITDRGYDIIDFNYMCDDIGIDYASDFSEPMHFNYMGAEKFSDYVAHFLRDRFDLTDHRGDKRYEMYDKEYEDYMNYCREMHID